VAVHAALGPAFTATVSAAQAAFVRMSAIWTYKVGYYITASGVAVNGKQTPSRPLLTPASLAISWTATPPTARHRADYLPTVEVDNQDSTGMHVKKYYPVVSLARRRPKQGTRASQARADSRTAVDRDRGQGRRRDGKRRDTGGRRGRRGQSWSSFMGARVRRLLQAEVVRGAEEKTVRHTRAQQPHAGYDASDDRGREVRQARRRDGSGGSQAGKGGAGRLDRREMWSGAVGS
jgi:hypothetical protein